jgi:hypothetical protein
MSDKTRYAILATFIAFALAILVLTSGCAVTQTQPSPLKLCAQSLVVIQAAQECTLNGPSLCMFTEGDWEHVIQAHADKQVYCPRLEPGQEEANQ